MDVGQKVTKQRKDRKAHLKSKLTWQEYTKTNKTITRRTEKQKYNKVTTESGRVEQRPDDYVIIYLGGHDFDIHAPPLVDFCLWVCCFYLPGQQGNKVVVVDTVCMFALGKDSISVCLITA